MQKNDKKGRVKRLDSRFEKGILVGETVGVVNLMKNARRVLKRSLC